MSFLPQTMILQYSTTTVYLAEFHPAIVKALSSLWYIFILIKRGLAKEEGLIEIGANYYFKIKFNQIFLYIISALFLLKQTFKVIKSPESINIS